MKLMERCSECGLMRNQRDGSCQNFEWHDAPPQPAPIHDEASYTRNLPGELEKAIDGCHGPGCDDWSDEAKDGRCEMLRERLWHMIHDAIATKPVVQPAPAGFSDLLNCAHVRPPNCSCEVDEDDGKIAGLECEGLRNEVRAAHAKEVEEAEKRGFGNGQAACKHFNHDVAQVRSESRAAGIEEGAKRMHKAAMSVGCEQGCKCCVDTYGVLKEALAAIRRAGEETEG